MELDIVKLPEGSYYGELSILLGTTSPFKLKMGKNKKEDGETIVKNGHRMAMVYTLDGQIFKDLCTDYPELSSSIYVRSEIRRAYFDNLASLSKGEISYNMKVIEFEKNIQ